MICFLSLSHKMYMAMIFTSRKLRGCWWLCETDAKGRDHFVSLTPLDRLLCKDLERWRWWWRTSCVRQLPSEILTYLRVKPLDTGQFSAVLSCHTEVACRWSDFHVRTTRRRIWWWTSLARWVLQTIALTFLSVKPLDDVGKSCDGFRRTCWWDDVHIRRWRGGDGVVTAGRDNCQARDYCLRRHFNISKSETTG